MMRTFLIGTALLFIISGYAQTHSRLIPKKGWMVSSHGLTWSTGSEINFFTPDKKQHHYFFTWWEQDADSSLSHRDVLAIGSSNTAVHGTYTLQQQGQQMTTHIDCRWNKDTGGVADLLYLKIWLPYFSEAQWYTKGKALALDSLIYFNDTLMEVSTAFGYFRFKASKPFRVRRNDHPHPQPHEYEKRAQLLVFYEDNIAIDKALPLNRHFTIEVTDNKPVETPPVQSITAQPTPMSTAWEPSLPATQVLPRPQRMALQQDYYHIPLHKPDTVGGVSHTFHDMLAMHWQIGQGYYPKIITQKDSSLSTEAYKLQVDKNKIVIHHQSEAGLQHALYTLLQMVQNQSGRLVIPQGMVEDAPAIGWRGIHMFTGAASWPFHRRMYERVLLPLKMNKTVLQCEQAQWKSFPNLHNPISISLKDLKTEFDYLRQHHVEPIPLIQSLGHMEWFFKPMDNRRMAVNPQYPYTLNAEKKSARKAIQSIWEEAFQWLQPKTMHIGFDEIGMIGFHLPREKEIDLWKIQLRFLHRYAQKKNAQLMLWGDMGLGPGEGPDALSGITKERAALLRSTIPPGTYVADWHYINRADPSVYKVNLNIWKAQQLRPIAATWFYPNNIRGFVLAAKEEGAGVLQTTWADFESNESNMLLNIEQFGAYVLAMDYAWSGRTDMPNALPYQPIEEWCTRFYGTAKPVDSRNGWHCKLNQSMRNITSADAIMLPETMMIQLPALFATGISLKAHTTAIVQEGTPIAKMMFYNGDQLVQEIYLRYGVALRSMNDQRSIFAHISGKDKKTFYHFFPQQTNITSVKIELLHKGSGLKIEDLILIE